jgi:hypothetical protein
LLLACETASAQTRLPAREVEAAYLINFLRYTQWPAQSFDSPQSPYVIGVVGSEDETSTVRAVAQAAGTVNGRPIEVRALRAAHAPSAGTAHARDAQPGNEWSGVHLVFFHESGGAPSRQELAPLAGKPVLTVADTPGFIAAGGMIELVNSAEHIVFAANPSAIADAQLVVSSKVLKLARLDGTAPP